MYPLSAPPTSKAYMPLDADCFMRNTNSAAPSVVCFCAAYTTFCADKAAAPPSFTGTITADTLSAFNAPSSTFSRLRAATSTVARAPSAAADSAISAPSEVKLIFSTVSAKVRIHKTEIALIITIIHFSVLFITVLLIGFSSCPWFD